MRSRQSKRQSKTRGTHALPPGLDTRTHMHTRTKAPRTRFPRSHTHSSTVVALAPLQERWWCGQPSPHCSSCCCWWCRRPLEAHGAGQGQRAQEQEEWSSQHAASSPRPSPLLLLLLLLLLGAGGRLPLGRDMGRMLLLLLHWPCLVRAAAACFVVGVLYINKSMKEEHTHRHLSDTLGAQLRSRSGGGAEKKDARPTSAGGVCVMTQHTQFGLPLHLFFFSLHQPTQKAFAVD
jgi:hypothetical protein